MIYFKKSIQFCITKPQSNKVLICELIYIQVLTDVGVCIPIKSIIPSSYSSVVQLDTVIANWAVGVTRGPVCEVPLGSISPDPGPIHKSVASCQDVPSLSDISTNKDVLLGISDRNEADSYRRNRSDILCSHVSEGMAVVVSIRPVSSLLNKLVTLERLAVVGPTRLAN